MTDSNHRKYTILTSRWFTNINGCIGVVAVETFESEWKAYIGIAYGVNQSSDEQHVAAFGNGLQPEEAHGFFPHLDIAKYKSY